LGSVAALLDTRCSELAHVVGSAGLRRADAGASSLADLISFRPHAVLVAVALGLRSVHEGALGLAHAGAG
jgi:hypothetical protein